MNETFLLVIIFIAFLIWLFILKPKAEESRIERERQQTKALARQEKHQEEARIERERQQAKARIERERLNAEARSKQERQKAAAKKRKKKSIEDKEQLLRKIRSTAPDFILKAKLEFEREFRSQTDQSFFGQEMSPLTCFGYRVGKTNGRPESERQAILRYAIVADLDVSLPFLPYNYRQEWGKPLSETRITRICSHLNGMADLRSTRSNFEFAISQWRKDSAWVRSEQIEIKKQYSSL